MGEWTEIMRAGEPELVRSGDHGFVQKQNEYHIRTTVLPTGLHGFNWAMLFGSQFSGAGPMCGYHDGVSRAIIHCWPEDVPELIETVEAAIAHANEVLKSN